MSHRGLTPILSSNIRSAQEAYEPGSFSEPATHPPLLTLMLLGLRHMGLESVNPWAFNVAILTAGMVALWGLSWYVLRNRALAFAVLLLALLNPFFVWVGLLYRDGATALLFVTLTVWSALIVRDMSVDERKAPRARWLFGAAALAGGVLLSLIRGTGFFIAFAVFGLAYLLARRAWDKKLWLAVAFLFIGFVALYAAYNLARVGVFTVSTNNGFNLYLGNHPAYFHAHPLYDVDVFLGAAASREGFDGLSEAERDRAFMRRALQFIKDDPVAFVYRSIRKTLWHWLNTERIPNYSTATAMDSDGTAIKLASVSVLVGLPYLLYKLAYLPLFVWTAIGLVRKRLDVRYWLLFAPMIGLWPVVVLTAPDTRFKMNAEVLVLPAMVAVAWQLWQSARPISRQPATDRRGDTA